MTSLVIEQKTPITELDYRFFQVLYTVKLMPLTLANWFVIHVKVFSFFMITRITASRPNGLDGHG